LFTSDANAKNIEKIYGVISFVSGEAMITKNKKQIPAKLGMKVEESDSITTGNGIIRIQIIDAYVCHIEKNTSVTFKKILDQTNYNYFNLELHKGQIFSKLDRNRKKPGNLSIVSPSITAGVRGTEFMVSETSAPAESAKRSSEKTIPSGVYVSNGSVDVEKNNQKINLQSGEQATIQSGEMIKSILDDYISTKLKILEELKIMKEFNSNLIEEQKRKNMKMLEELK